MVDGHEMVTENPEWLSMLSGHIALWAREAIDRDTNDPDLYRPTRFPVLSRNHGWIYVEVRITR